MNDTRSLVAEPFQHSSLCAVTATGHRGPCTCVHTDKEFLARLKRLGSDWRYSDEFIGIVVRSRYPRDYDR